MIPQRQNQPQLLLAKKASNPKVSELSLPKKSVQQNAEYDKFLSEVYNLKRKRKIRKKALQALVGIFVLGILTLTMQVLLGNYNLIETTNGQQVLGEKDDQQCQIIIQGDLNLEK